MIEQALEHIHSGKGNCATACYRALLPYGVEPSPLHDFIVMDKEGGTRIEHIAICAALEAYRQQRWLTSYFVMSDTQTPSRYFESMFSKNCTDPAAGEGVFLGALLRRCFERVSKEKERFGHVLAVSAVDIEADKLKIVDRGPVGQADYTYTVRLSELDALVTNMWKGELIRVLILVGLTPDNPLYHLPQHQAGMEHAIREWTAWEQSYTPAYNMKQYKKEKRTGARSLPDIKLNYA